MNAHLSKLIISTTVLSIIGSAAHAEQADSSVTSWFKPSNAQNAKTNSSPTSEQCCKPCCEPVSKNFDQGYGFCNNQFPAGYNAPARFSVQCPWNIFVSGSFLYWHANQEGMDLAYNTESWVCDPTKEGKFLLQDTDYHRGFKAGIGFHCTRDDSTLYAEYTQFYQTTKTQFVKHQFPCRNSVWAISNWKNDTICQYSTCPEFGYEETSNWSLHLDAVDLTLSRPYYQSCKLTVSPFTGLSALWIRQRLNFPSHVSPSKTISKSWAVGPEVGVQTHWHFADRRRFGHGWRLEAQTSASILYTRYDVAHKQADPYCLCGPCDPCGSCDSCDPLVCYELNRYSTLRPAANMALGLGWGRYFDLQCYHLDLLAAYEFKALWGQNMMRAIVDTYATGASFAPGNLYIHGLTLTARLDF